MVAPFHRVATATLEDASREQRFSHIDYLTTRQIRYAKGFDIPSEASNHA